MVGKRVTMLVRGALPGGFAYRAGSLGVVPGSRMVATTGVGLGPTGSTSASDGAAGRGVL